MELVIGFAVEPEYDEPKNDREPVEFGDKGCWPAVALDAAAAEAIDELAAAAKRAGRAPELAGPAPGVTRYARAATI